jgi:ATP-binding cassette subfamily B protein
MVRLTKPCWPHLAVIALLSLVSTPLSLLVPLPLKIAVDTVIGEQAMPSWIHIWVPQTWYATKASSLMFAAGLLLAIAVLSSLQALLSWLLQTYTGERLVHDFRAQLLWHAQRLSLAFHDRRGANDTAFRIQYDAPAVQNLLLQGVIPLFTSLVGFFAVLAVTLQISPKLAAVSLIISPVLYVLARNSSKKVRNGYDEIRELDSSAMLVLYEALAAVRSVKAFGQESHQDELFRRKSRLRMKEQIRLASVQAAFHVLIGLSIAGATAVTLVIGITQVRQNLITVGELLLVMAYMAQLYEPLRTISTKIPELQASMSSLTRATAILDEIPEITETENAIPTRRVEGNITMRNVGFQYSAGSRSVLHDVSFEVPAGACVGIIGASGSGKSTLINLITRFYDPSEGQVFLDGIDIRQYDLRDLRRQFSIVLQEPMLFSTTVAGNIAYGDPDANRDEVIAAAKLANAHEFIENLQQGYNTQIGEKGVRLSGGERQRIAIARAFLKNAPIVILDEPTSAVDLKTESAIMGGIENLARGRTTFMIAHRLSTLERCDTVLVMKDGRLNMVTNEVEEARRQMLEASRPHIVPAVPQGPQPQGPQLVI